MPSTLLFNALAPLLWLGSSQPCSLEYYWVHHLLGPLGLWPSVGLVSLAFRRPLGTCTVSGFGQPSLSGALVQVLSPGSHLWADSQAA